MYVQAEAVLSRIPEELSSVVDAELRARLQERYLGLLQEYHARRRAYGRGKAFTPEMNLEAQTLLQHASQGRRSYYLAPGATLGGLGTLASKFRGALASARAALERLAKLADLQRDMDARARWGMEIADLSAGLDRLEGEADYASANVNLSRLDALANEVQNTLAAQILTREAHWSKLLDRKPPALVSAGTSAALSVAARPDLWSVKPGAGIPSSAVREGATEGYTLSGDGFWTGFQNLFSGMIASGQADADKLYGRFKATVLKAAQITSRHRRHAAEIEKFRAAELAERGDGSSPETDALAANLAERQGRLNSLVAEIRSLAAQLRSLTAGTWVEPEEHVAASLGQLDAVKSAAMLLFAPQVEALEGAAAGVERDDLKFEEDTGLSAGMGKALGVALPLLAGAGLLYALSRRRKGS